MDESAAETSENNTATADPKKTTEEEIKDAVGKSKFKEKQKQAQKKQFQIGGGLIAVLLVGFLIYLGLKPYQGSKAFGVCKVFLELQIEYPPTVRLAGVRESGNWVRIWYAHTDSFGEYKMERLQCNFRQDEKYGFALDTATIERRKLDPAKIESFNRSLPIVLQNMPDLTLPSALPTNLRSLQFQTDLFRQQLGLRRSY